MYLLPLLGMRFPLPSLIVRFIRSCEYWMAMGVERRMEYPFLPRPRQAILQLRTTILLHGIIMIGSWEEMEMTISNDSNTSINTLMLLMIAGSLATVGIATNALHIVIGGMLVAPGFMPIVRVSLAMISKYRGWLYGLLDFVKGYLALIAGAAVTSLILHSYGIEPTSGTNSYYVPAQQLIQYWSTVTFSSILASAVASIAGALLVATQKSVFTSGVMIGLALVPSAAIIPLALIAGDTTLAGNAAIRFFLDVLLVFVFSFPVLIWARMYYHRRNSSIR